MGLDLFDETFGMVGELERRGIDYAVVGAIALAVHGAPRATSDIDLLVRPEDVAAAVAAARARGFTIEALPMRFAASDIDLQRVSRIEGEETLTVDLLLVGPSLEPVWATRHDVATHAGSLRVISRDALIRMKALAGREQDAADIRRLQELDG